MLEDSGYMARAAFVMDRVMKSVGLHGKSFIPMLLGFGCSIPAIMATRAIESRRARMTTMMVIPLMSCSARLPIYALIIPAFFAGQMRAWVLWVMYLIGVSLAMVCAWLLRKTLFALIASPCMATVAVIRRESGSWGWAAFQFLGLTVLAWIVTVAVFQTGTLLGFGV